MCAQLGDHASDETIGIWEKALHVLSTAARRLDAAEAGERHLVRDILVPALKHLLAHKLPADLQASRIAKLLTLAAGREGWPRDEAMELCKLALRAQDAEAAAHDTPEERNWPYSAIQRDRSWTLERMYDLSGDIVYLQAACRAVDLWFANAETGAGVDRDRMGGMTVGWLYTKLHKAQSGK